VEAAKQSCDIKEELRAKNDPQFANLLSHVREGRAWNGQQNMDNLQKGAGKNYTELDYETLLSRWPPVMVNNNPKAAKNFKDAPIIVGETVLRDALNNKIVEGFATKTKQDLHYYHANNQFKGAPLSTTLTNRLLRAPSNMTEDSIGQFPLVPGMKLMITDNIVM
jgi:hypothetical protein